MPCGASARPRFCSTRYPGSTRSRPRLTPIHAPPISGRRTTASSFAWLSWSMCWETARWLHCHEPESSVVGDPAPLQLQPRPGQLVHPLPDARAAFSWHRRKEIAAKHAEPIGDAIRAVVQRCWPVEQVHEHHLEPGPLQQRRVLSDAREVPRVADPLRGDTLLGERLVEGADDGRDIPTAAHLRHEPPAWSERPQHRGGDGLRWRHPVQRGIGEDSIRRRFECEVLTPGYLEPEVWVEHPGPRDHRLGGVDSQHLGAGVGDLRRQPASPAAEVDDPLAWPRRQQLDHASAKLGDYGELLVVERGVPASFSACYIMFGPVALAHPPHLTSRRRSPSLSLRDAGARDVQRSLCDSPPITDHPHQSETHYPVASAPTFPPRFARPCSAAPMTPAS